MNLASATRTASDRAQLRSKLDLPQVLEGAASAFPNRPALTDAPNRPDLSGTMPVELSLGALRRDAARIAGLFAQFRLAPGSTVAIQLPNVPEAALALLAVMRAGLCPLMLPVALDPLETARAIEAARCEAVITLTRAGDLYPAETMREIAVRYFGLRFITAFGEDVPDGVIGLDRLPWSLADGLAPIDRDLGPDYGLVATYDGDEGVAYGRTSESLIATALGLVSAARMKPGQRIVSLLPPDDLAGLAAGLVPSLTAGIPLATMGLFDSNALEAMLAAGPATQLLVPAWIEPALTNSPLAAHPGLAGVIFVHRLPFRTQDTTATNLSCPVVDVLAIGEHALFIAPRAPGQPTSFDLDAAAPCLPSGHALVEARVEDGLLALRGRATRSRPLAAVGQREPDYATAADLWHRVDIAVESDGTRIVSLARVLAAGD